jgi:hypothetical protein
MPNRGRCPELPIGVAPPLERRYTCSLIRMLLPITSMAVSSRNQSASPALRVSENLTLPAWTLRLEMITRLIHWYFLGLAH